MLRRQFFKVLSAISATLVIPFAATAKEPKLVNRKFCNETFTKEDLSRLQIVMGEDSVVFVDCAFDGIIAGELQTSRSVFVNCIFDGSANLRSPCSKISEHLSFFSRCMFRVDSGETGWAIQPFDAELVNCEAFS